MKKLIAVLLFETRDANSSCVSSNSPVYRFVIEYSFAKTAMRTKMNSFLQKLWMQTF